MFGIKKKDHGGARDGAGRPPLLYIDKKKPLTVYLTDTGWEMLTQRADQLGLTPGEYIEFRLTESTGAQKSPEQ